MTALKAGLFYFALVFLAGFVLGTIRVLLVIPAVGETIAVLIELPIMLTIAWFTCRWIIRRASVPAVQSSRIAMGIAAFALLMIAEYLLTLALGGTGLRSYLAQYSTLPGLIGLAGQIAFGVFPLIQSR